MPAALLKRVVIGLGALSLLAGTAQADVLRLKNGDRVTGQVKAMVKEGLSYSTGYGDITIPWNDVLALETETPVTVYMKDGQTLSGPIKANPEGQVVADKDGQEKPMRLTDVAAINEKPTKIPVTGRFSAGWNKTDGNTHTEATHLDGNVVIGKDDKRFKADGDYNWAETDGQRSAHDWKSHGAFDYFLNDRLYTTTQGSAEHDQFQDLEIRTTVGQGLGYQFIKNDRSNLSAELGGSYVHEDITDHPANDYPAARWAVDLDHYLYKTYVQLFHKQIGLLSMENTDRLLIQTQTGLRFPITGNFFTTAQYNYDWTNKPSEGKKNDDEKYLFTVGYEFK